mmetsp:Transcript_7699/g.14190  ORF Transcript_7699/g.14190 Transcript_7699/m.14190 type:complete len:100 (-) Transcript_7699:333-632(-)
MENPDSSLYSCTRSCPRERRFRIDPSRLVVEYWRIDSSALWCRWRYWCKLHCVSLAVGSSAWSAQLVYRWWLVVRCGGLLRERIRRFGVVKRSTSDVTV